MLGEGLRYRQIFMDGRPLESDPFPSWMGHSVGRWEGDTLVVESNGFNDRSWLDGYGHPHSEALRTTERYRRPGVRPPETRYHPPEPAPVVRPLGDGVWTV